MQAARLYADELVRDSADLVDAFQNKSAFTAARTFDGIIDVATEIGALLSVLNLTNSCQVGSELTGHADHAMAEQLA